MGKQHGKEKAKIRILPLFLAKHPKSQQKHWALYILRGVYFPGFEGMEHA
jgi:hypothetical protein